MQVMSGDFERITRCLQMKTSRPSFQPLLAIILCLTFTFGLAMSQVALAELTDESMLGPSLYLRPAYDGSASQRTELAPIVRYYGQPWFIRSTEGILEGGVRTEITSGLHVGGQLAFEPGRLTKESDFLKNHGMPNVNSGASLGIHLEFDHKFGPMPISLLARARKHANSDRGAQADLRLSAGVYSNGRIGAGIFTQATWANAKSASSIYDVTAQQSSTTGLRTFSAGSGWLFASFGILWSIDLNPEWIVVGSVETRRLHGDASRSPLVERDSNYYASAGVAYRF